MSTPNRIAALLVAALAVFVAAGCSELEPREPLGTPETTIGTALAYDYLCPGSTSNNKTASSPITTCRCVTVADADRNKTCQCIQSGSTDLNTICQCEESADTKECDPNYFWNVYNRATTANKTAIRDDIMFELMDVVDADYQRFELHLRSDRAYKDFGVKVASLSLTTAASFASEGAAHILAAIDTGLKGASDAVDVSAFNSLAPEIIINQMRADRLDIAAEIKCKMKEGADVYSLQEGIRDIGRYFSAGSVTSALTSLAGSTAAAAAAAKDKATLSDKDNSSGSPSSPAASCPPSAP